MSIRARLDRITRELSFGELFDGATVKDLARTYFAKNRPEFIKPGVRRAARFIVLTSIVHALLKPDRERTQLEETIRADVFRSTRGWPVVATPEKRREWEGRIVEAEGKATATREKYGIAEGATISEVKDLLMTFADEFGFTEPEKAKLQKHLGEIIGTKSFASGN